MLRRPAHWFIYFGIWTLMALYYTSWDVLAYHGRVLDALPLNFCQNMVWALEGLLIIKIAERFPIHSFSLSSLPAWIINLGSGILMALLGLTIAWLLALAFQGPAFRHKIQGHLLSSFTMFMSSYLHSTLLLMWAILGAFHGVLLYQGMKSRELEKAQLESSLTMARNQMLLAQFQPHFLFNALNSISSLIHSDPMAADRMVARLGDLLRLNLDSESTQEIPLEKEMALVDAFLAIEKVRFQDRLEVEVDIPGDLAKAHVPKFILQPLVENSVKHGISTRARVGKILIRACREDHWLVLEVQDNGAGFEGTREGVGLRNTRARLQMLYHENQQLDIFSVPDKGTRIIVRIPLR